MISYKRRPTGILAALVIMLLLFSIPMIAAFAAANTTSSNQKASLAPDVVKELQAQLGDYLKKDTDLRHWKLLDTKISLVSQESSGAEVSAVFHTEREYRLNYAKADDAPALKGRSAFMKNNAKKLSQKQLEAANKDIEIWRQELNQCINTDQTGVVRVKVAGTLDSHGKLIPDSLKFYFEQNGAPDGGVVYIPAPLSQIPTPQAVEKDSYDAISSVVNAEKK